MRLRRKKALVVFIVNSANSISNNLTQLERFLLNGDSSLVVRIYGCGPYGPGSIPGYRPITQNIFKLINRRYL